ncbi:MBL fold metallo-hydrolase [Fusobacterium simiae]|uniref:MBL fold metallo-hydrolase n=1 Tax=Fusobacterium simiae TaxID=855 RepID=A0ABT4DIB7_FUSSI|nr:MBL fold metallo-hydrolase [Fusobacterium simiae]MCY7008349.1 MBL fold metallo-hydrolase [Fusobacterium simiae]
MEKIKIKIFPAFYGDCFLITIQEEEKVINILIDGGLSKTYEDYLKPILTEIAEKGEELTLLICTHIDSDHIRGLISFLADNNTKKYINIKEIWFNGFEQIINSERNLSGNIKNSDENIIDDIIKKGYEDEFIETTNISIKEGISLSSLIEYGKYNHNTISNKKAIVDSLEKIEISKNISIKIINPNTYILNRLEKEWQSEMNKKNFYFSISKNLKLVSSFEFLISRLRDYYTKETNKISSKDSIEDYLTDLKSEDYSIVNESSISFILEAYNKKFLFLGDSIIRNKDKCNIISNIINEYGDSVEFEVIKLSHHGSNCNISKDFINIFKAKEYIFSTNSERFDHPDMDVIANLILEKTPKALIFNYPIEKIKMIDRDDWKNLYNYQIIIRKDEDFYLERSF